MPPPFFGSQPKLDYQRLEQDQQIFGIAPL